MIGSVDEAKGRKKTEIDHEPKSGSGKTHSLTAPATAHDAVKNCFRSRVFTANTGVTRIVAESLEGLFRSLLPHRRDCVSALVPGILTYETKSEGEIFVAVDEGILVKTGPDVLVSVRRALAGADLGRLRESVEKDFLSLDESEVNTRAVMEKLENGFIRRFAHFQHE